MNSLPQFSLTDRLAINRVLVGLWQVADIEKDGDLIDPQIGADHLAAYVGQGFNTYDMADHYGSAELLAGALLQRDVQPAPVICTKWCPPPGPMTADIVRAGVQERLDRLATDRVDLLQFHWWNFGHPAWLNALHEMSNLSTLR